MRQIRRWGDSMLLTLVQAVVDTSSEPDMERIMNDYGTGLLRLCYLYLKDYQPVSYTHLDVYKRQLFFRRCRHIRFQTAQSGFLLRVHRIDRVGADLHLLLGKFRAFFFRNVHIVIDLAKHDKINVVAMAHDLEMCIRDRRMDAPSNAFLYGLARKSSRFACSVGASNSFL